MGEVSQQAKDVQVHGGSMLSRAPAFAMRSLPHDIPQAITAGELKHSSRRRVLHTLISRPRWWKGKMKAPRRIEIGELVLDTAANG